MIHNPDPTLMDFVREKVCTLVEWDVLQFFHHNPHTLDAAPRIARALGRDVDSAAHGLQALVKRGLLKAHETGSQPIYALTDDDATRDAIERFMRACDEPAFRRQAIEHLLRAQVVKR